MHSELLQELVDLLCRFAERLIQEGILYLLEALLVLALLQFFLPLVRFASS